jgi:hypothetical protein
MIERGYNQTGILSHLAGCFAAQTGLKKNTSDLPFVVL